MPRPLGLVLAEVTVRPEDISLHYVLFQLGHETLGIAIPQINAQSGERVNTVTGVTYENNATRDVTFWEADTEGESGRAIDRYNFRKIWIASFST